MPHPVGGVMDAVPGRLVSTDAISTSPLVVVAGRPAVNVVPNVVAVETAPAEGRALSPLPEPETVPRTKASARNPRLRRSWAIFLDPIGARPSKGSGFISPPFRGELCGGASLRLGTRASPTGPRT